MRIRVGLRKIIFVSILATCIFIVSFCLNSRVTLYNLIGRFDVSKKIDIEKISSRTDANKNGVPDSDDFVAGARKQLEIKPVYLDKYYSGGFPPENEGVCTDIVWRALKNGGYDLKKLLDADVENHKDLYFLTNGKQDRNIDFRRVNNLRVFFKRFAKELTRNIIPLDKKNLVQWQGGDIVVFKNHIAIVSDLRRVDGIPFLIHHIGVYPQEEDFLLSSKNDITGHFRFPKG